MSNISVDIDNARAILSKINAAAEAYKAHVKQAKAIRDQLDGCWVGASGDAMQEKLDIWIQQQTKIGNDILSASAKVRRQVDALAESDLALAEKISGA